MLEMLELAERLACLDRFGDTHGLAVDDGVIEFETRLAARRRSVREHLERGGEHGASAEIAERIRRMLHHLRPRGRERTRPGKPILLHVKRVIQHIQIIPCVARRRSSAPAL